MELSNITTQIIGKLFLLVYLGEHFTSFALTRCVRTGIPKLNRHELSDYEMPLPNIEDQRRICSHLEALDIGEQNLHKHRAYTDEVKRQISREYLEAAHV